MSIYFAITAINVFLAPALAALPEEGLIAKAIGAKIARGWHVRVWRMRFSSLSLDSTIHTVRISTRVPLAYRDNARCDVWQLGDLLHFVRLHYLNQVLLEPINRLLAVTVGQEGRVLLLPGICVCDSKRLVNLLRGRWASARLVSSIQTGTVSEAAERLNSAEKGRDNVERKRQVHY